ncbi:MAG TPA: pyridoxamine 5'-phosphate oxidase family protein [Accumulibacter sp.]|nr:pyridoxamine 5'-phosphate oxidase family protein [Accumulibacter sp.]
MLMSAVRQCAEASVLCWLATADESGSPNVSPKELFAVFDERHLVIANIASPRSVRNIACNPRVCVSFIDVFVQKGFKISGHCRNCTPDAADFFTWFAPLREKVGTRFRVHSVLIVTAQQVEPIIAPSYRFFPDETSEASQVAAALHRYGVQAADSGA